MFISDIHLGTKNCRAEELLGFLRTVEAETIFLVGDVVDFWQIRRQPYWPQTHNDVVQVLLKRARNGTNIIFIPGNHDDDLRAYCGQHFGGIELKLSDLHETADGRRFLVMHGDEFDVVVHHAEWLAKLGDTAYVFALWLNTRLNWVRRHLGLGYWSLSAFLKQKVKQAVAFIGRFEKALVAEAARAEADGVICGHIHHAAMRQMGDILYVNTGDWVESCTAVCESHDGTLEVMRWFDMAERGNVQTLAPKRVGEAA
ncbi:MAG: UDP-2,3-diacylglucosamine diphosphatase [Rhizobiales bacterium]|nr:UDP-2,3-diacylglucosamine diphosphatase [Hyphomicrobiales bacterium]